MSDPIRDDTTPPHAEPFPLYSFEMPPVRETRPQFVPREMCQRLIDSFAKTDAEFYEAFMALQEFLEGGTNNNSGARAPIQGQC